MDAEYNETVEHNRVTLFEQAERRVEKDGKVWNDLSGEERDAVVQSIVKEWAASDVAPPSPAYERKSRRSGPTDDASPTVQ